MKASEPATINIMKLLSGRLSSFCFLCVLLFFLTVPCLCSAAETTTPKKFTGSRSCIECHENFYDLWATSFHGLAMQPYSVELAREQLKPHEKPINISGTDYRAVIDEGEGYVLEKTDEGEKKHEMVHVLGGKNIFYFLTLLDKGRLQVLPLAYDLNRKEWYDTTASAVRHFEHAPDEALDWRETPLTFNTSCYSCHVSQLSTNYEFKTDTYNTTWKEPGINCETCHGPAGEHVETFKQAECTGQKPEKLHLISMNDLDQEQINTACSNCHAKMRPITSDFMPGERYFDHYDLTTLEDHDFYPDGRDLGENYTYTTWRMNKCVKSSKLDCTHCHTSSGRNRFEGEKANQACMPCHEERIENIETHSHHSADGPAGKCITCHMPRTEFARMIRHDHSFRPPTPEMTIVHKSPNACNICHDDKDPEWANKHAKKWFGESYQDDTAKKAKLVDMARQSNWEQLEEMLNYIKNPENDEVFTTSLVRLLASCPDNAKWDTIRQVLENNASPLVRSAAATTLANDYSMETRNALIKATQDKWRLVRIQAAYALSIYPRQSMSKKHQDVVEKASKEYIASLKTRQDNSSSFYNLGNYFSNRGWFEKSIESYESAMKLDPDNIMPLVNLSIVYARLEKPGKSQTALEKAHKIAPKDAGINFNLGLLLAEKGQTNQAKRHMQTALDTDPNFAEAAFNLAVMTADTDINETIKLCKKAYKLRPDNSRYGYTLAYYLFQSKEYNRAIGVLVKMIEEPDTSASVYSLLGEIYKIQGRKSDAVEIYRKATQDESLSTRERYGFESMLQRLDR